jgi:hypothetical protein
LNFIYSRPTGHYSKYFGDIPTNYLYQSLGENSRNISDCSYYFSASGKFAENLIKNIDRKAFALNPKPNGYRKVHILAAGDAYDIPATKTKKERLSSCAVYSRELRLLT